MEGTEKPFLKGTLQHKKVSHLSPRALCLDYSFYIARIPRISRIFTPFDELFTAMLLQQEKAQNA